MACNVFLCEVHMTWCFHKVSLGWMYFHGQPEWCVFLEQTSRCVFWGRKVAWTCFFDRETCLGVFFHTFELFDTMHAIYLFNTNNSTKWDIIIICVRHHMFISFLKNSALSPRAGDRGRGLKCHEPSHTIRGIRFVMGSETSRSAKRGTSCKAWHGYVIASVHQFEAFSSTVHVFHQH